MTKMRIVFLTGTRADFGKLKSLMLTAQNHDAFDTHVFVTGMHLNKTYGNTYEEINKSGLRNIYKFINHDTVEHMDRTLAKTVDGFSHYVKQLEPDLVVIHGDRVEALAGSIVGSLNNILVAHVEGGEVSGTIDELIRHAVSKLSHIHFVANEDAKNRLMQLGEKPNSISVIGSPDVDIMFSDDLPTLCDAKKRYDVFFEEYAIAMLHPVTTEYANSGSNAKCFVQSLLESKRNYIVIYPNNDPGSLEILKEFEALKNNNRFRIFPSIRFEHFLTFLKNASLIVGNSSAGVREAPYYGVPAVDIGTRQNNRVVSDLVKNVGFSVLEIVQAIEVFGSQSKYLPQENQFGGGNSAGMFIDFLLSDQFKNTSRQKEFQDLKK